MRDTSARENRKRVKQREETKTRAIKGKEKRGE